MKKILIVEDDQIVANIYKNKFSVEGFQVEIAFDGEKGLDMVRSFRPDAVILDLMLPKITGVELMRKIRSERDFEHLPVIVFSNTYLTNMVQEAWKAGATKCLSKANCTPKQVINVVRTALSLNGSPQSTTGKTANPQPAAAATQTASLATAAVTSSAESTVAAPKESADRAQDTEFQGDLRQSFIDSLPGHLSSLRGLL